MNSHSELKIFAGSGSEGFAQKMCDYLGISIGKSRIRQYSDNNTYVKIEEKVRGMDVYIVQTIGFDPNNQFMELLFWVDAFKRSSVASVTAIIPYFGYAKADKKDEPRVSIRARVCADSLEAAGVDRVVVMDLHSPQIQGFFKKPVDHLYAAGIFLKDIKARNIDNLVIASPDEGFAKNARYYSDKLDVPLVIGNKRRVGHDETAEIVGMTGDCTGKNVVVVDDFAISFGTHAAITRILKEKGAKDVYVYVTHNMVTEKGLQKLMDSQVKMFITTDTVNNPRLDGCPRAVILSVADLFGKTIKLIHDRESLGELFDQNGG